MINIVSYLIYKKTKRYPQQMSQHSHLMFHFLSQFIEHPPLLFPIALWNKQRVMRNWVKEFPDGSRSILFILLLFPLFLFFSYGARSILTRSFAVWRSMFRKELVCKFGQLCKWYRSFGEICIEKRHLNRVDFGFR